MAYRILFSDATPPREFDPINIDKVLEWANNLERQTVIAIETPHYTLSVLRPDEYKKAVEEFDLGGISGV